MDGRVKRWLRQREAWRVMYVGDSLPAPLQLGSWQVKRGIRGVIMSCSQRRGWHMSLPARVGA